jgi:glyceraldehyde 3-phosphate dehydrogenase
VTKIGINGFGRIGRNIVRAWLKQNVDDIELVAVNDLTAPEILAHLLHYDSTHGVLQTPVGPSADGIVIGGRSIRVLSETDPTKLPWGELGVEVVIESTGRFTDRESAAQHLQAGARKVIISAPSSDADLTTVMGVNETDYDPARHHVISNASCTTNSVVPMAKVLLDNFGISSGFMTTIHAYTTEQQLQDQVSVTRSGKPDLRRMRAAALNIVPASTGAARAMHLVIPELKGKVDGMAMRVPVPDGSVTDLVCLLEKDASVDDVNSAFKAASAEPGFHGILSYTEDPIVSSDIVGNPSSCTIDGLSTMALGRQVKVIGWYDNEWGYSNRVVDLVRFIGTKGFSSN